MKVTIKGITASTIAFNTIGIILRGDSRNPEQYPNSIARHIDIVNDEQMRELISVKNAGLVQVEREDIIPTQPVPNVKIAKIEMPKIEEVKEEAKEEVEDSPSAKNSQKKFGRPKGSKNKVADQKKQTKISKPVKAVKSVSRVEEIKEDNKEENTEVIVMTPSGPVVGKATRSVMGDLPESQATQASIDALKELEANEAMDAETTFIDESKLDPSERMGEKAIIVNGMNSTEKVSMKNSILPEADAVKNAPKFIQLKDADILAKEDKQAKDSFIDNNDNGDEPNDLIEI